MTRRRSGVDRRVLPVFAEGELDASFAITGMTERVDRDTVWAPHSHATHELIWNQHGASTVTLGPRTWTIAPRVGLWIPAGRIHSGHMPAGTWYRTAHFDVDATPRLAREPVAIDVTPLLALLLERLADPALAAGSRELTERLALDLLEPSPNAVLVRAPGGELLRPIAAAIEADPADRRTLGEWAAALGVSDRTISRAFRAETGMSFAAWQAAFRAQRAALMLTGGAAIDDVAEAVGYGSVSAFGAAFRRATGMTPGQLR